MANRLINETSPYLLQHAHNPVDWYAWGPEVLERAAAEDKLILLSIGYSACRWCHVMEHESFENPSIAKLMNDNFVNIKVDREERPDLDQIYMTAVQMMTGSGGWPMTVFLLPDGTPVFGGTYFPPEDRYNRPGFARVLDKMAYGGMYDQVGGAFHRYSTDDHWLVPHFEKMLYDNALLARVYVDAHRATGKALYKRIAEETLDFVIREMRAPNGSFYSTQDADSEGVEGKFYVWLLDEFSQLVGDDAELLAR